MNGYQLKIEIANSKKPIWRSIKIPALLNFEELHQLIQILFGFTDCHLYEFKISSLQVWATNREVELDYNINNNYGLISIFEKIENYFYKDMKIDYCYDFGDAWEFIITVEREFESIDPYPVVLDYCGDNLIEDCGGIGSYQKIIKNYNEKDDLEEIKFDLESINSFLITQSVDEILNNSEFKNDFVEVLSQLKSLVKKRKLNNYQVIKLVSKQTTYWVILKTLEGYVIQLFLEYHDLLAGFYNLANEGINNAFCNCWTFLLFDEERDPSIALDSNNLFASFRNEPGNLPAFLEVDEAKVIFEYLQDLITGIKNDENTSESDEIIEIMIEDGKFKESSIFVYEGQIDLSRYEFGYLGDTKIETKIETPERLCVDIVCLPCSNTYKTNELTMYAIIAGENDYLIKEVDYPSLRIMGEALIDGLIEYINLYGKPQSIAVGNLNVLFLILNFINTYELDYIEDEITPEIAAVLSDAFGVEDDELFDDPFIQDLLAQLDGKSEEEIEAKLNEILANMELLN